MNRKDPELGLCLLFQRSMNSTLLNRSEEGAHSHSKFDETANESVVAFVSQLVFGVMGQLIPLKREKPGASQHMLAPRPTMFMQAGKRTPTVMFVCVPVPNMDRYN